MTNGYLFNTNKLEAQATIAFLMGEDSPHNVGQPAYEEIGKKSKYKWLKSDDGVYAMVQNSETVDKIAPGLYILFQDNRGGLHAEEFKVETDELFILPNNHIIEVTGEVEDFATKAELFNANKFKHKRGIMLEGPGGTGKTSIMDLLATKFKDSGHLVFVIRNANELMWYIDFMHDNLRIAEPDRLVIVMIEDIDKFMDGGGVEHTVLNWLEGPNSVNHQIVIATTNYFETLNELLLRPSRFDYHVHVDKPTQEAKKAYLVNKGLDTEDAEQWSQTTDEFSLAELKELFISVRLLGIDYDKAKARINKQAAAVTKNTGKRSKKDGENFGFFGKKKD